MAQTGSSEAQKLFDIARKKYFERHPAKALSASKNPADEMGALDVVEQGDDDEGVEVKSEESNGDSNGKSDLNVGNDDKNKGDDSTGSQDGKEDSSDDEKSHLMVGFKPQEQGDNSKDDKA